MNSKQEGWLDQVAATILRLANRHLNEILANENMATEAYKVGNDKDGAVYETIANFHMEAVRELREVLDIVFEQGPDTDVDKDMDVQDRIIKRLQTIEETIREDKERNQFLNATYADGILYGLRLAVDAVTAECTQVREH